MTFLRRFMITLSSVSVVEGLTFGIAFLVGTAFTLGFSLILAGAALLLGLIVSGIYQVRQGRRVEKVEPQTSEFSADSQVEAETKANDANLQIETKKRFAYKSDNARADELFRIILDADVDALSKLNPPLRSEDLNHIYNNGYTLLHLAVDPNMAVGVEGKLGEPELVQLRLDEDNGSLKGRFREKPKIVRNTEKSLQILDALLTVATDEQVNAVSQGAQWTPLHVAANHPEPKFAQRLLAKHANPNAKAKNDVTPLHVIAGASQEEASGKNRQAIAEALLKAGANPKAEAFVMGAKTKGNPDKGNMTPADVARHFNELSLLEGLEKAEQAFEAKHKARAVDPKKSAAALNDLDVSAEVSDDEAAPGPTTPGKGSSGGAGAGS